MDGEQLANPPAYVKGVQIAVRIFVHVVSKHFLQPRFHGIAFGNERVSESSDEGSGRQRSHVFRESVDSGSMVIEAEGARRRVRQRRVRAERDGAVVVVVRGVVVEGRRGDHAGPVVATCGESTVTREHEERAEREGIFREDGAASVGKPNRPLGFGTCRSFRPRHAQSFGDEERSPTSNR